MLNEIAFFVHTEPLHCTKRIRLMIKQRRNLLLVLIISVFVSCAPTENAAKIEPESSIYMAQRNYDPDGFNDALLTGTLQVKNDCLFVGDALVIWPRLYTLDESGDVPTVLDESGEVVFRVGEKAYLGGSGTDNNRSWFLERLIEPIPEWCDFQEIWNMSEPLPVEYRDNVYG